MFDVHIYKVYIYTRMYIDGMVICLVFYLFFCIVCLWLCSHLVHHGYCELECNLDCLSIHCSLLSDMGYYSCWCCVVCCFTVWYLYCSDVYFCLLTHCEYGSHFVVWAFQGVLECPLPHLQCFCLKDHGGIVLLL